MLICGRVRELYSGKDFETQNSQTEATSAHAKPHPCNGPGKTCRKVKYISDFRK